MVIRTGAPPIGVSTSWQQQRRALVFAAATRPRSSGARDRARHGLSDCRRPAGPSWAADQGRGGAVGMGAIRRPAAILTVLTLIAGCGSTVSPSPSSAPVATSPAAASGAPSPGATAGRSPSASLATSSAAPAKVVTIGISLPLSGEDASFGVPIRDGALLAIREANDQNLLPGYRIETKVLDHAVDGRHDPTQGANDMLSLSGDPTVVAVVGPAHSSVAKAQIPLSNAAGLLQCSPTATFPGLTQGTDGAAFRVVNPDRISFIRVSTPDDLEGPAMAHFGSQTLGAKRAGLVDDGSS